MGKAIMINNRVGISIQPPMKKLLPSDLPTVAHIQDETDYLCFSIRHADGSPMLRDNGRPYTYSTWNSCDRVARELSLQWPVVLVDVWRYYGETVETPEQRNTHVFLSRWLNGKRIAEDVDNSHELRNLR